MIAFRALSSVAQAAAGSVTVSLPAGLEPGDVLVCAIHVEGGSGVTITPPPGWRRVVATNDGATARLEIFRARAVAGRDAESEFAFSGSVACVVAVLAYGGVDQAEPVEQAAGQANAASTSATAPSVTTTRSNGHLLVFWAAATGTPSATPPAGMTTRLDLAGAALSLATADAAQATAGASGTKVATLSGASTSIGVTVALSPAALNTPAQVRDEGGWRHEAFAPRFRDDTGFDAFIEGTIQRANRELFRQVGASFYAENGLADPWNALLARAEMHLAQAELLNAAAGLVGIGDDAATRPFLGRMSELRSQASERRRRAREIIALCRTAARPGPGAPWFTAGTAVRPIRPLFDDTEGLRE